ncbi:MAG: hypothetical protein IJ347_09475 [Faecalibacterium sp.]|nr:hypothetical protein [Faecalibacterium sp.]
MLNANKTITVVNHWYDKAADTWVYACHVLHGCSWFSKNIHIADGTGLHRAFVHQIRIPTAAAAGAAYCEPQQWAALSAAEKAACWTLGCEAKLVLGEIKSLTAAEYAALPRLFTVAAGLTWHDNRNSAHPHWYAEGS